MPQFVGLEPLEPRLLLSAWPLAASTDAVQEEPAAAPMQAERFSQLMPSSETGSTSEAEALSDTRNGNGSGGYATGQVGSAQSQAFSDSGNLGTLGTFSGTGYQISHPQNLEKVFHFTAATDGEVSATIFYTHWDGNIDLSLYDAGENLLDASSTTANFETVVAPVQEGQTYYLLAEGDHQVNNTFDLEVEVSPLIEPDKYEPNSSREEAYDLGELGSFSDTLTMHEEGDLDFFRLTAAVDGQLTATADYNMDSGGVDVHIRDGDGRLIPVETESGGGTYSRTADVIGGETYYVFTRSVFRYVDFYDLAIDIGGDDYEPNASFDEAYDLGTLAHFADTGLTIHEAGNDDYFRFTSPVDGEVEASILFASEAGDLDLRLYDADRNLIDASLSDTDDETTGASVTAGDSFYLRVEGRDGALNTYDLRISVLDGHEPNASFADAVELGTLGSFSETGLTIHEPDNDDFFGFVAGEDGTLDVSIDFDHDAGDLDLWLYDADQNFIHASTSRTDGESLAVPVLAGEAYYLRVTGWAGQTNWYDVDVTVLHEPPPSLPYGGPLVGVDFGTSDPPENWALRPTGVMPVTLTDLTDESGNLSPYLLNIDMGSGTYGNAPSEVSADQVPLHTSPLDDVGGNMWTDVVQWYTWSGLDPDLTYEVYVFAIDTVGKSQHVSIIGEETVVFDQPHGINDLVINTDPGDKSRTLGSYAIPMTPDADGEIVIEVEPEVTYLGVGGVAIRPEPVEVRPEAVAVNAADIDAPTTDPHTFSVTYESRAWLDAGSLIDNDQAVHVAGPRGFEAFADYVAIDDASDGPQRHVTYQLDAPDGEWTWEDAGTYTISLVDQQVADVNGLYAPAGEIGAFEADPAEVVDVPDPALEQVLRDWFKLEDDEPITSTHMASITSVGVRLLNAGIEDLTGMEYAINLESLDARRNAIEEVTPLHDLKHLERLHLDSNNISDLSTFADLEIVNSLGLSNNDISDVTPLADLTGLRSLRLQFNQITSVEGLGMLGGLELLHLNYNAITDLAPLGGMDPLTNLRTLNLKSNAISDLAPLAGMSALESLRLAENAVTDIAPLAELTALTSLDLGYNAVTEIGALADLTQLTQLHLGDNAITDAGPLADHAQLERLDLGDNYLTSLPLEDPASLSRLHVHRNYLDVSPQSEPMQVIDAVLDADPDADVRYEPQHQPPAVIRVDADRFDDADTGAYVFDVVYEALPGLDMDTLIANDEAIRVTGPDGFEAFAAYKAIDDASDGTFRVVTYQLEAPAAGWADHAGTYTIHVEPNQVADVNGMPLDAAALADFDVNMPPPEEGVIEGVLFHDIDGDGSQDADEPALENWTVYIDRDQTGELDEGDPWTVTDEDGVYRFEHLADGTYPVTALPPDDWNGPTQVEVTRIVEVDHAGHPEAYLFDFQELPTHERVGPYQRDGFEITRDTAYPSDEFTVAGPEWRTSPPTNTLYPHLGPSEILIRRMDRQPFTLSSLELADMWNSASTSVSADWIITYADGFSETITLEDQAGALRHFDLDLVDIVEARWIVSGQFRHLNDVQVIHPHAAPPEVTDVDLAWSEPSPPADALTFAAVDDATAIDANLDGTFTDLVADESITNRWFASTGQERGVFAFDLRDLPDDVEVAGGWLSLDVTSFTSTEQDSPLVDLFAYDSGGHVSAADGHADAVPLGTSMVNDVGEQQFALDAEALELFLGGYLGLRMQNVQQNAPWVSVASIRDAFREAPTLQLELETSPLQADAGEAYEIDEGESLTLDASDSSGTDLTYGWRIMADEGAFDHATGVSPTLTWSELTAFIPGDGEYTVYLQVTDVVGQTDTDSATLTVHNLPPVAEDVSFAMQQDDSLVVDPPGMLANVTDPGGDPVSVDLDSVTGPEFAEAFSVDENGAFEYTPVAGFVGTDSFTFRASDGQALSNEATVAISVDPADADVSLTPVADGTVVDTSLDGTFTEALLDEETIRNRWFASTGHERGIFVFEVPDFLPQTQFISARLGLDVQSFTGTDQDLPQIDFLAFAGDGQIEAADGHAAAEPLGSATLLPSLGYQTFQLDAEALEPFSGGHVAIRMQNAVEGGPWASVSSTRQPFGDPPTLLLDVDEPPHHLAIHEPTLTEAGPIEATVTRSGDLSEPYTVALNSNEPNLVSLPESVTIAAGEASATFEIDVVEGMSRAVWQRVEITASGEHVLAESLELDPTFGMTSSGSEVRKRDVVTLADGSAVTVGWVAIGRQQDLVLTRMLPDGTLDASFGEAGIVSIPDAGAQANAVEVTDDGRIVVVGGQSGGGSLLARYHADGTLDESFGDAGMVTQDVGKFDDLEILDDGRILAAGSLDDDFQLARYHADGTLDESFGDGGVTLTPMDPDLLSEARAISVLDDGHILLGGLTAYHSNESGFGLARYTAEGELDPTFGDDGVVIDQVSGGYDGILGMAVDAQGRILATGRTSVDGSVHAAVVRYTADGDRDHSFGVNGLVIGDQGGQWSFDGTIDAFGNVLVLSRQPRGAVVIDRLDNDGSQVDSTTFSGANNPQSMTLSEDGRVTVVGESFVMRLVNTTDFTSTADFRLDTMALSDVELDWSSYFGGDANDAVYDVAVGAEDNLILAGFTQSTDWISGGFDTEYNGGSWDAFVAKLDPDGNHVWSTYLGGSGTNAARGVAVDAWGNIYVTGETRAEGWVSGGFDTEFNGDRDGFIAKLSADGDHLWSSYLGGSGIDRGHAIAVDGEGNVAVTGETESAGWVSGGFDEIYGGGDHDGFAVMLDGEGNHLWSTYLGGDDRDLGRGVAFTANGDVLLTGQTVSDGWVSGGHITTRPGASTGFAARLDSAGGHLWSTYVGGNRWDTAYGIAEDEAGDVYLSGSTVSDGWVSGGFKTERSGQDAFVVKLSGGGDHVWSTYLGGEGAESSRAIVVDPEAGVLVSGRTQSAGWVEGGFDTQFNGEQDVFLARLSSDGGHVWSTYLGGSGTDSNVALAVGSSGTSYVAGHTRSDDDWVRDGTLTSYPGGEEFTGFMARITDTTEIADADPPRIQAVYVAGSEWSDSFTDHLEAEYGYPAFPIPAGEAQLDPLPWVNLDQVFVAFDREVDLDGAGAGLYGVNQEVYDLGFIGYDVDTFVAGWSVPEHLDVDKLLLHLPAEAVTLSDTDVPLDGEWVDGESAFPSGDGTAGGDFAFRFNVLPGDVNQTGDVFGDAVIETRNRQFTFPGDEDYSIYHDVDGSGSIFGGDVIQVRNRQFTFLPEDEPALPESNENETKTTSETTTAFTFSSDDTDADAETQAEATADSNDDGDADMSAATSPSGSETRTTAEAADDEGDGESETGDAASEESSFTIERAAEDGAAETHPADEHEPAAEADQQRPARTPAFVADLLHRMRPAGTPNVLDGGHSTSNGQGASGSGPAGTAAAGEAAARSADIGVLTNPLRDRSIYELGNAGDGILDSILPPAEPVAPVRADVPEHATAGQSPTEPSAGAGAEPNPPLGPMEPTGRVGGRDGPAIPATQGWHERPLDYWLRAADEQEETDLLAWLTRSRHGG